MTELYGDMAQEAADASSYSYDNSAAVLNSAVLMTEFDERSAQLRAAYPQYLDLRYGPGPRHRIDYFPASRPGPLLVFLAGGFWRQRRSKENFSFLAAGPLAHGVHVAVVGHSLMPDRSLEGVVGETRSAIAWLREHACNWSTDADNVVVAGWSSGAHLAALMLDEPGVRGGLAISGVYDLEPLLHTCFNDQLRLCSQDVARLSPLHRPLSRRELVLACGAAELPEIRQQAAAFAQARQGLPGQMLELPGHNHFTILNDLASPDGVLTGEIGRLAGR